MDVYPNINFTSYKVTNQLDYMVISQFLRDICGDQALELYVDIAIFFMVILL